MKGWSLTKPKELVEKEVTENEVQDNLIKIKITKSLVNYNDLYRFNGENDVKEGIILGSFGVGVIIDSPVNLFGLKKGDKVFIESRLPCENCYNCNNNNKDKCISPLTAGEDFDGFLRDFVSVPADFVYSLPDSVNEDEALLINYISIAENIIDSLEITKGQYVSIVGVNNFSIILSQLLIYYQAVPIIIAENDAQKEFALNSGAYYVLTINENITKEVSSITGGRMTDNVVYICDLSLPVSKAFSIASYGANIAFTGFSNKITSFSFNQAIKKQLKIHCINNVEKNTPTSINLIVNKAIDVSKLNFDYVSYKDLPSALTNASQKYEKEEEFKEIIVNIL